MNVVRHSNVKSLRAIMILAVAGCIGLSVSCSFLHKQPENKVWNGIIIPAGAEPLTDGLIQRIAHSVTAPDSIRPIIGQVYMGQVWGNQWKPPDNLKHAIINLGEALNRYTNLDVKVDTHLSLDNFKHHETPFIFIFADTTFSLTEFEQKKFSNYLRDGGFAFIDNTVPESSTAQESLRKKLRDSLGKNITFKPVPYSHPIFHCFFDFLDGQPYGKVVIIENKKNNENEEQSQYFRDDLEGIWLDNRMVAIYSNNGYCFRWKELSGNRPHLSFGVNLIVYSLLREGGILHRNNRIQSQLY